jgi:hypothetical protein
MNRTNLLDGLGNVLAIVCVLLFAGGGRAAAGESPPGRAGATAVLLEDHPEPLLAQLQGQDGGQSEVDSRDVFSGSSSVKIIPMQRFHPGVAGWAFRIAERPRVGEYRYLRFAWRADGARGIMLQLHDQRDWNIRYTAGLDEPNWGSKFVAPAPPDRWTVVTRDLFADFGEREIHGIALTVFGGAAGHFDHIYLGRTIDDLDRVDATGLRDGPPPHPSDDELDRLWSDLGGDDAARAYSAFWTLVHAPRQSVPFLRGILAPANGAGEGETVRRCVDDLASADPATRQAAARRLSLRCEAAAPFLGEALLDPDLAPEARRRIERLLDPASGRANADRARLSRQALRFIGTADAKDLLADLATVGPPSGRP